MLYKIIIPIDNLLTFVEYYSSSFYDIVFVTITSLRKEFSSFLTASPENNPK
jgi:hypothetical protein